MKVTTKVRSAMTVLVIGISTLVLVELALGQQCWTKPATTINRLPKKNTNATKNNTNIPCENPMCSVTRETLGDRMFPQHPKLAMGGGAKVIFILGYPFSGTSATHYLLSTSNNVTTLTNKKLLSPREEGWSLTGFKTRELADRWDGVLEWVDWAKLAGAYGRRWSHDKPLKIENSPPEIQAPKALKDTFEPRFGKVKFLLLVRGECTLSEVKSVEFLTHDVRASGYRNVVSQYPDDTFVLRFEDICFFWDDVFAELVRWEPLLADIDISRVPNKLNTTQRHRQLPKHLSTSVLQYCESVKSKWQGEHRPRSKGQSSGILNEFGYEKTTTCNNQ